MNAFLDLFKRKDNQEQPEANDGQPVDPQVATAQEQLRIQREQLELQQRQYAEKNPEYEFEKDKEKYLTPENVLDKLGAPVMDGDELRGFVPKEALDFYQNKTLEPKLKELEELNTRIATQQQDQYFNQVQVPNFAEALNTNYGYMMKQYPGMDYSKLLAIFSSPEILELANKGGDYEREALTYALQQYHSLQELDRRKAQLQIDESDDGGRPLRRQARGEVTDDPGYLEDGEDGKPKVHFVLVNSEKDVNIQEPKGGQILEYATHLMQKNNQLGELGQDRRIVEVGTVDMLKRLQKKHGIKNVKVDRQYAQ